MKCGYFSVLLFICGPILHICDAGGPAIIAIAAADKDFMFEDGLLQYPYEKSRKIMLIGSNLDAFSYISFSKRNGSLNSSCEDDRLTKVFKVTLDPTEKGIAFAKLDFTQMFDKALYLCAKFADGSDRWVHQGDQPSVRLKLRKSGLFGLPIEIILVILLFCMSGLFSGLNLGLMALDPTELNIIARAGSDTEKKYAKQIRPIRVRGNYLLCTLLLGNVLVNSTLTIFLDTMTGNGWTAVVFSTLGIVIFGEIIPQACCSRHGLAVGAKTLIITKLFMVLTFPLSYPISVILDKVLGDEIGNVYSREKLGELIRDQGAKGYVKSDEVNIITGALSLTTKTVKDVMTPLEDSYMIPSEAILDFDTMNEIVSHGFTRVPVYEDNDKTHVCAVLNVKDLAFIDPDDKTPLKTVYQFYQRPVIAVDAKTKLDAMLTEFRQGKAHMVFVDDLCDESDRDPCRRIIGLVTLEDVIEEIIQAEIVDETDIISEIFYITLFICT